MLAVRVDGNDGSSRSSGSKATTRARRSGAFIGSFGSFCSGLFRRGSSRLHNGNFGPRLHTYTRIFADAPVDPVGIIRRTSPLVVATTQNPPESQRFELGNVVRGEPCTRTMLFVLTTLLAYPAAQTPGRGLWHITMVVHCLEGHQLPESPHAFLLGASIVG